jgi:hypothetical protein
VTHPYRRALVPLFAVRVRLSLFLVTNSLVLLRTHSFLSRTYSSLSRTHSSLSRTYTSLSRTHSSLSRTYSFCHELTFLCVQERNPDTNTAIAIEDVFFLVCFVMRLIAPTSLYIHACMHTYIKRAYKTFLLVAALPKLARTHVYIQYYRYKSVQCARIKRVRWWPHCLWATR